MKIFHKIVKSGSDLFKGLKRDNTQKMAELEKLEKEIEKLQLKEAKSINNNFVFDRKFFFSFWIIGLVIVFGGFIFYKSLDVIYLILAAFILSFAIEAIIDFFQKRINSRAFAIVISYLFVLIFILGGFLFIIPFTLSQLSEVIKIMTVNLSDFQFMLKTQTLNDIVLSISWLPYGLKESLVSVLLDPNIGAGLQSKFESNIDQLVKLGTTYAKDVANLAVNMFGSLLSFIVQLLLVLTLSVLFSIQKSSVMKFIAGLGGTKDYKYILMKLDKIYKQLGIWLKSQLLLCFFVGAMMLLTLWIFSLFGIDIPNKMSLAFIIFLTELIPYFGPIIGGSVAALVAFIHLGWYAALLIILAVFFINRLENNVLIPLLMNKTLGVNPVVIFISMLLGGLVIGFVGVLLAVPIAVIITLLVDKKFED